MVVDDPLDLTFPLQVVDGNSSQGSIDLHSVDEDGLRDHLVGGDFLEDSVVGGLVEDDHVLGLRRG